MDFASVVLMFIQEVLMPRCLWFKAPIALMADAPGEFPVPRSLTPRKIEIAAEVKRQAAHMLRLYSLDSKASIRAQVIENGVIQLFICVPHYTLPALNPEPLQEMLTKRIEYFSARALQVPLAWVNVDMIVVSLALCPHINPLGLLNILDAYLRDELSVEDHHSILTMVDVTKEDVITFTLRTSQSLVDGLSSYTMRKLLQKETMRYRVKVELEAA